MQEVNQEVVESHKTAVTPDGSVVQKQTQAVNTQVSPKTTLANLVWYVVGLITILLAMRFVMKLMGANPDNAFVSFLYSVTGVMSAPFDTIFGVTKAAGTAVKSVLEPSILVAIAVYLLIAWGIVKLLQVNEPK
jgi:hypothetical protein